MSELPPTNYRIPSISDQVVEGVRLVIQYSGDDGYYGFAFVDEEEVIRVGPFKQCETSSRELVLAVRTQGFWGDNLSPLWS